MENRQLYCAKNFLVGSVLLTACLLAAGNAHATQGDNLIGIGPIARSMGGVGVLHHKMPSVQSLPIRLACVSALTVPALNSILQVPYFHRLSMQKFDPPPWEFQLEIKANPILSLFPLSACQYP